jgi:hypothetical protein
MDRRYIQGKKESDQIPAHGGAALDEEFRAKILTCNTINGSVA